MLQKVVGKYSDGCALNNNVTITMTGIVHQQEQTFHSIVTTARILLVTVYNRCGKNHLFC